MSDDSPQAVKKSFSPDEFADLLTRAATSLVERCRAEYCEPVPPPKFVFALRSSRQWSTAAAGPFLSTTETVQELVHSDGSFRDWINLSPIAVTEDATVLEVDYSGRFTNRLIVGELAFPFEPFHLLGPNLPADWVEGTPKPKVSLATINENA